MNSRVDLEARWFALTREQMPGLAKKRDWPVRFDHCFQRILLDNVVQDAWRKEIAAPAYRHATYAQLTSAIIMGEKVIAGEADLEELNHQSLRWRDKG